MPRIIVDGDTHEAAEGVSLLQACVEAGLDLPYFCWHPALGSVGACRQCAVKQYKDENDRHGRIVMACMTPADEGTRISIRDEEAAAFRAAVIEWMMANHPHDCPVCDEGGECHLQDMTVLSGHVRRRYPYPKRTFRNQYLGPFLHHEMNRCITCYRCVRFYRDYAGGRDLDAFGSKSHVYFGRHADGVLESPFSGNLVEVCPTGVFTDRTERRHYTRKWDLQSAPSVCPHCAVGCNTLTGERHGMLRRVRNRYNPRVNGWFLCDRGRFGYEFANGPDRLRAARLKGDETGLDAAMSAVTRWLGPGRRVLGIGSSRASLEANFALRELVGPERFCGGFPANDRVLHQRLAGLLADGPAAADLETMESADAVLVVGDDIARTAPRVALALRQAVRNAEWRAADEMGVPRWHDTSVRRLRLRSPLFIAQAGAGGLDDVAEAAVSVAPEDAGRIAFAVAAELDGGASRPAGLSTELRRFASRAAAALSGARRPLVVAGVSSGSEAVIEGAANAARALSRGGRAARLYNAAAECNAIGAALLGGMDLENAFELLRGGEIDTAVVLENDLFRRAGPDRVTDALRGARLVVLDCVATETAARADAVLPAAPPAETDGTWVNAEGRAQRAYRVMPPADPVRESWRLLSQLGERSGRTPGYARFGELTEACAAAVPALRPVVRASVGAGRPIVRQPPRFSGRTALTADHDVRVVPPDVDRESPLVFSMEGVRERGGIAAFYRAPGWNSVQSLNRLRVETAAHDGAAWGKRLFDPAASADSFFRPPARPGRKPGPWWRAVPVPVIFGGEELSARAPAVMERMPAPHLVMGPGTIARLGVADGDDVTVRCGERAHTLPAHRDDRFPDDVVGVPDLPLLHGIRGWVELWRSVS